SAKLKVAVMSTTTAERIRVESVFFMVRSSSVFLFVARYYRKERARMGIRGKIVCNTLILNRKSMAGGLLRWLFATPERGSF
ncbi:MAG TPA: hypothetical protein VMB77_11720, partial [Syntrophales bacterium]|nr:hypothetical protein [Syntrophales bacterium]